MPLNIQNFLRVYGNDHPKAFADLKAKYGIDAKRSERHPSLVLFKYDQIDSPMGERIVQECRGLILDSENDWNIVAFPFTKFFNYGEGHAAPIDWNAARVTEKLDGSLMTLYHYRGEWNVASSGNPDAAGQVNDFGFSFADLFWKTWDEMGLHLDLLEEECTYMFELTSPYNRVVVPHKESKLTLIGVRHLPTLKEDRLGYYAPFFPVVQSFPMSSWDAIVSSFDKIDGTHFEGYVVVDDETFNRVKVKHPQYVALHHLKDSIGTSKKRLVEIIRANESTEFLTYFPEFKEDFDALKAKYHTFIDGLDEQYEIIRGDKPKVNRKDFAAEATKTRLPSYMFARLDGKVENVKQFVKDMQIDSLMKGMGCHD